MPRPANLNKPEPLATNDSEVKIPVPKPQPKTKKRFFVILREYRRLPANVKLKTQRVNLNSQDLTEVSEADAVFCRRSKSKFLVFEDSQLKKIGG